MILNWQVIFLYSTVDNNSFKSYTNEDWKKRLSPEQYHICREKGTEPVC